MLNMKEVNNLEALLVAIGALKAMAPDGKMVGESKVSNNAYFENFISIGTVYKTPSGKFKVIVDAIFYPAHKAESGKQYDDEIRFISYEFDPDTLDLTGKRNNVGYNFLKEKCEIVTTNLYDYVIMKKVQNNMGKVVLDLNEDNNDIC